MSLKTEEQTIQFPKGYGHPGNIEMGNQKARMLINKAIKLQ